MLLQAMVGLIIGAIIIIAIYSFANWLLYGEKDVDYQAEFEELATALEAVSTGEVLAAETVILQIPEGDAFIGIGKEDGDYGRWGDGDFHSITAREEVRITAPQNPNRPGERHHTDYPSKTITSMRRPAICPPDESCVCWCQGVSFDDAESEYLQNIQENRYSTINDMSYYVNPDKEKNLLLSCQKISCASIGESAYYNPLLSTYYTEVTTSSFDPIYIFENGFAIHRIQPSAYERQSTGSSTYIRDLEGAGYLGYAGDLEKKFVVQIMKVINGDIAVCFDHLCFQHINAQEQFYQNTFHLAEAAEVSEDESLSGAVSFTDCGAELTQNSRELTWEFAYLFTERHEWSYAYTMSNLEPLNSYAEGERLHVIAQGNDLQVQLISTCENGLFDHLLTVQVSQHEALNTYTEYCDSIDFTLQPGDNIMLTSIDVLETIPGDVDTGDLEAYITCPSQS